MQYTSIKVPIYIADTCRRVEVELLWRGIDKLKAKWLRELLSEKERRPLNRGNIYGAAIIRMALTLGGKTEEEINSMGREEVIIFLKENGYKLPPKWEGISKLQRSEAER